MRHHRWHRSNEYLKSMILPLVVFLGFICFLAFGLAGLRDTASKEGLETLKTSVMRGAIQCYAIEGMYPPGIAYLEDHYGIIVDHNKYIVHYDAFASNILPDIMILEKLDTGGGLDDQRQ